MSVNDPTLTSMTDAPAPTTLVHGFWVTPHSWENFIRHYEARGYRVLARRPSIIGNFVDRNVSR
jgi:hypothetical protein